MRKTELGIEEMFKKIISTRRVWVSDLAMSNQMEGNGMIEWVQSYYKMFLWIFHEARLNLFPHYICI